MTQRSVKSKKVCVVGGAGFLGSHLVNYLVEEKNCDVMVVDNLIAGRREFIHPEARFEHHDITESESHLLSLLIDHGTEFVFNYAAWPYIPDSVNRPIHVFSVNAIGAFKVMNAAQEAGCEAILQVSSAEIYGEGIGYLEHQRMVGPEEATLPNNWKISENAPVIPHSTYGAAKAAIDALVQVRVREAKTPVIALRQFNCIGERETHPYVVPEIISQILGMQYHHCTPCVILGNNSTRDFLYAEDSVKMAVDLIENGKFGEVYNMGSESSIKIFDLAKLIGRLAGYNSINIQGDDPRRVRPWEIWHLESDNTKLYKTIKTRPEISLEGALTRTINYYVRNGRRWVWEKPQPS